MSAEPGADGLRTEALAYAGLDALDGASGREDRARILAAIALAVFDDHYAAFRHATAAAKSAFEARDWPGAVDLARRRLTLYRRAVERLVPVLGAGFAEAGRDEAFWTQVEAAMRAAIAGRYEADLAFAFLRSLRRALRADRWEPVTYGEAGGPSPAAVAVVTVREGTLPLDPAVADAVLDAAALAAPWRDRAGDARALAAAITARLVEVGWDEGAPLAVEFVRAGFFRNRGAYLVGRVRAGTRVRPLVVALLHGPEGVFADALLTEPAEVADVFSTTLANFAVPLDAYHALAAFLHDLVPGRPLGAHYATIGFNHLGKGAVMEDLRADHARTGAPFDTAVGFRGTVAIGFSAPGSRYVLKIVRDRPTAGYKWGRFDGIAAVLDKYRRVHESDRAGSMLDNVLYRNVALPRDLFAPDLLDELLDAAAETVSLHRDAVLFRHLIVQLKMVPLPTFLAGREPGPARAAVDALGTCIRNNAAAGIFNKDFDARNYGVGPTGRVFLFDYDAVEPLLDVKVRTNADREEGEEGIPDWYFEDGTVFLPEELAAGLQLEDPALIRFFRQRHADLLTAGYWEGMQRALAAGEVPPVLTYPPARRLERPGPGVAVTEAEERP